MVMKNVLLLVSVLFLINCKNNDSKETSMLADKASASAAVILHMEGKTFTMQQKDLNPQQKLDFDEDQLQYMFYTNESIVSINFNLTKTDILNTAPITYTIPDVNAGPIKVDLSFFNKDRKTSRRTNKRVVFKKGAITIKELTKNNLNMEFTGEGTGVTEASDTHFPITGTINISYN